MPFKSASVMGTGAAAGVAGGAAAGVAGGAAAGGVCALPSEANNSRVVVSRVSLFISVTSSRSLSCCKPG